ncbi:MAG TPA: TlpA family protein disulfide reductase [Deltaproteobacteria bacterium]|nr:TlpA family protein disulfide reductase [Deltaproteobacteria bacterium]
MPVWQALYEELGDEGFVPITVALDASADAARPYIERAEPKHPSLIDTEHVVAHRYGMINVPTVVWIDEEGRIARPNTAEYGTDTFLQFHGRESGPFLDAVRAWVRRGEIRRDETVPERMPPPTEDEELARAEWALGWFLHRRGSTEAAARHFDRAGELSPDDWTIRRGSMPIRGQDPMGPEFFELFKDWEARGRQGYARMAKERL